MAEAVAFSSAEQEEQYRRCVSQAKQEARNGKLEESIRLFRQAHEIRPSKKLVDNIEKLEEALASLALEQEDDDGFVDVCQSGLMVYGELHDKLFDHQREGVAFLYSLYRDGKKGGILADDMGLGKTIQIIAFLSGMFDAELIQSVLLVMPTTLISNWKKEFASWAVGLRVKVFHGACKGERTRNLERIQRRTGVVLTSYHMLLNNWQQLSSLGGRTFVWDYVILDEAHKIKTPSAKITKSVHAIPSKNRILLTGTPVQNNLQELWALFDFACQGSLLGTLRTFRMEYENPITRARAKDATPGERALGLKISENLMSIIKPYFLRRSKDDIKEKHKSELKSSLPGDQSKDAAPAMPSLPRKNDFIIWVYLAPIQEKLYRDFLSLDHIKELLMTTRSPLAELNILKKLCDHPRLLSARACSQLGLEASAYSEQDVGSVSEADGLLDMNKRLKHISDGILIEESGKLIFLVALLKRLQEEGHRTLVFSQSRKMLDIIERILTCRQFKLMRIDGTVTDVLEREKRIGVFQNSNDYSVFLLTTQVGGVGITLTAATRVVIFDPSWNPATDAQAVDRAYRIGQKENVVIYRLITCGTVEEKIYRRQIFKDSLIRQTTGDKKNPYRYFTMQELRELFTLGDCRTSATQLQLQALHATQRRTDSQLDEHIAYLHSLGIFGLSDHDLMYTCETGHEDEADSYVEHRVKKAQELVQLESQLNDIRNATEGSRLGEMESSTKPKKKSQKNCPSDPLVPPITVEPTNNEVINLVTDDEDSVAHVSSIMASLVIEDGDQMLHNLSKMDTSLSQDEQHKQTRIQACDQQNDINAIAFLSQAHSVSNEETCSPEPKIISDEQPAAAITCFKDEGQMPIMQKSFDSASDHEHKLEEKPHSSLNVLTSLPGEMDTSAKIDATTAFTVQANEISENSLTPEPGMSEMVLTNDSLAESPLYQADFNLVLEDSEDRLQDESKEEVSVEDTANEGFQLRLDSFCSSAAHSYVAENRSNRNIQTSKSMKGSIIMDSSNATRDSCMDNSDVVVVRKKLIARIVSDGEEDEGSPIIDLDNYDDDDDGKAYPSNNPNGIWMSTPKANGSMTDLCFSPIIKMSGRRSTASRRSLANMLLEQVEDIAESVEMANNMSNETSVQDELQEEPTQENSGQESVELEEESIQETSGQESVELGDESIQETSGQESVELGDESIQENSGQESVELEEESIQENSGQESVELEEESIQENSGQESVELEEESVQENSGQETVELEESIQENSGQETVELEEESIQENSGQEFVQLEEPLMQEYSGQESLELEASSGETLDSEGKFSYLNDTGSPRDDYTFVGMGP